MFKKIVSTMMILPVLLGSFGVCGMLGGSNTVHAADQGKAFELIPKAQKDYSKDVEKLTKPSTEESFWDQYNDIGDGYNEGKNRDLGSAIGSGVITWDTILTLLTQVIRFIANAAMVVGSGMFIYAGYLYVTAVYSGDAQTGKANEAIKDAVIGVVIVIFSYAIQKIIVQAFLN